jgi:hypothetical protein
MNTQIPNCHADSELQQVGSVACVAIMVASSQPAPNDILPVSVANICELTYMCDTELGPDIHANNSGYGRIADTIAAILP